MQDRSLRDLTFDSLNSLKRRELLQATFIDRLTAELLPSHPDYYGAMAWVLMMLELWLQHHHDPFISAKPAASAHAQPA
jgi:asparagine synthase (glutamine-hydrolysing)